MKPEKLYYLHLLGFLLCFGPSRLGSAAGGGFTLLGG